jgi:hypothetical protein
MIALIVQNRKVDHPNVLTLTLIVHNHKARRNVDHHDHYPKCNKHQANRLPDRNKRSLDLSKIGRKVVHHDRLNCYSDRNKQE